MDWLLMDATSCTMLCVARSDCSRLLISCEAIQSSRVVRFPENELVSLMIKDATCQDAFVVVSGELIL